MDLSTGVVGRARKRGRSNRTDNGKKKTEKSEVGKGSRVKPKHKGEGGGRGRQGAAGRKIKMFGEKEEEEASVEERKEEDTRGSRRKAKREW